MILCLVPYHSHIQLRHIASRSSSIVVGVSNEYICIDRGRKTARFAVFEEADCKPDADTFIDIARKASEEAFGRDLVAMVVETVAGFHIYLDMWTDSYFESLLKSARFRDHLPCSCRDYRHVASAVSIYMKLKWYRYVLRASPTKHLWDWFRVVYRRKSTDPCHEAYLREVEALYRASVEPVP